MIDNSININNLSYISDVLISWYQRNKRELPWRNISDPYPIWISEIILQQTQIKQGYDYFLKFIRQFPTIRSLAEAPEDDVLKCWQGLGYYSRARNLRIAAQQIMTQFGGNFPDSYEKIRTLKGVGEYTAAAIASFAFGLPYAVTDGNVYRFLSRFFGCMEPIDTTSGKKNFTALADQLLNKQYPSIHNQAIMEFGALQCTPNTPSCHSCPLQAHCFAATHNMVAQLPVKERRTKVRNRYFNYFILIHNEHTYLQKRDKKDVWQNLYEFPLYEADRQLSFDEIVHSSFFQEIAGLFPFTLVQQSHPMKHILSHQVIYATFYIFQIEGKSELMKKCMEINCNDIAYYPISRLIEKFIQKNTKIFLPFTN